MYLTDKNNIINFKKKTIPKPVCQLISEHELPNKHSKTLTDFLIGFEVPATRIDEFFIKMQWPNLKVCLLFKLEEFLFRKSFNIFAI
jgi:hypothetical protein